MRDINISKFTCEVCGREGYYPDFLDLNDDDNDPWGIFTICSHCVLASRKIEIYGSLILLISLLLIPFFEFQIKTQIPVFIFCYILNFLRRVSFSFFLISKIRADNVHYSKSFVFSKIRNQFILFIITPLDLVTSPFRLLALRRK